MAHLTVAVVEDDPGLRELLQEELESAGYDVRAFGAAETFLKHYRNINAALVISDIRLPGMSGMELLQHLKQQAEPPAFILITAFGTVSQAVDALKEGADDFLTKPLDLEHLLVSVERVIDYHKLQREVAHYRASQRGNSGPGGLVGESKIMRKLYDEIEQVALADGAVLIQGESGTGKELVARALHQQSARAEQPFLAVNCAGIPAELMESEFFGHASGAFTGAQRERAGLLREADGGTLLLDEIGEMPLALQAKLLRVLQEGTLRAVGSDQEQQVNVRIIAATHQDLEARVRENAFRADLFYRLETFRLRVPPLRERGDDKLLLAHHFFNQLRLQQDKTLLGFSPAAQSLIRNYQFPGNVRELQNAVERAYTFCQGDWITPEYFPERMRRATEVTPSTIANEYDKDSDWATLQEVQERYVKQVLQATEGNKVRAAKILGVTRRTLYRWLASVSTKDN
ncbi:sigma-54-dependent transcriptional regulator [Pseudidiomarina insulisalsae]|uniref:Sigma-54-dependent Fis family transcriptional regulator n=1 Tax=Pseudidiomarina insulisalsae TaxID=575789 RepID=A0A432YDA2_9GAMM|nr:sigma-54 dependent transcriptional regulator [Pseudidiomarina insulisalsae]RUO58975.1 sigma-54-dependent Fis family transcriptional regulator [Pseudidiomarina insulisalsae]